MLKEHERVVLTTSLPDDGLVAGDVGTVVHVYPDGRGLRGGIRRTRRSHDGGRHARQCRMCGQSHRDMTHTREIQTV